jgi:energy-coupling factor transporter transmembrane protein EcfT
MYDLPYLLIALLFIVGMYFAAKVPMRWWWAYVSVLGIFFVCAAFVTLDWGYAKKNNLPVKYWVLK